LVIISENGAGASPKTKTDLQVEKKKKKGGINEEKAHVGSKMEM